MNTETALQGVGAAIAAGVILLLAFILGEGLYQEPRPLAENAYPIVIPDAPAAAAVAEEPAGPEPILPLLASADPVAGEAVAKQCAACHSFDEGGPNKVGPNLWNVVNAPVAARDGFNYSGALAGLGGAWNYDALNGYLYDPKAYAPGNRMAFRGVKDTADRAALIAYLRALSADPAPLPGEAAAEAAPVAAE